MSSEVQQLVDMGFAEVDARQALQQANSDVAQAIERLLSRGVVGGNDPVEGRRRTDLGDDLDGFTEGLPLQGQHVPPTSIGNVGVSTDVGSGSGGGARGDAAPRSGGGGGGGLQGVAALPPTTLAIEDRELDAALEISMQESPEDLAEDIMQPANEEERLGCGLRNIGNTCYANSFLQTLMHIDEFRDRMLRYRPPSELSAQPDHVGSGLVPAQPLPEPDAEDAAGEVENTSRRKEHCIRLACELRELFAYSILTMRRFIDPTRLLNEVVDERGKKLPIGSQEDVGEFMLKFLERLDEGLRVGEFAVARPANTEGPEKLQESADAGNVQTDWIDIAMKTLDNLTDDDMRAYGEEEMTPPETQVPATVMAGRAEPVADATSTSGVPAESDERPVESQCAEPQEPNGTVDPHVDTTSAEAAPEKVAVGDSVEEGGTATEDGVAKPSSAEPEPGPDEEAAPKKPSLLQTLFFGQQVQVFSYREGSKPAAECSPESTAATQEEAEAAAPEVSDSPSKDGADAGLVVSEERSEFLQIFLDVKYKDLYSAWEATSCTEVDYTTPSGAITKASTRIWIERQPKLLFFQMQRVVFDQEKKTQVKLDETFEFDSTIYVDRFLLENKELSMQTASKVRELRAQQEALRDALQQFEEYRGRGGLHASDVLGWAAECLKDNAAAATAQADGAEAQDASRHLHPHPHQLVRGTLRQDDSSLVAHLNGSGLDDAVRLLESVRDTCLRQQEELEREVNRLTGEIQDAYRDLRSCAYELSAIWVHQGNAGSGHYWAYLRDWRRDRWLRYDDAVVSEVTWPQVREASVGQAGSNTSAYVLVYISKELAEAQTREQDPILQRVQAIMPQRLLQEIDDDNSLLVQEQRQRQERLADQLLRQHAEAIFQEYAGLIHKWEKTKRETADQCGNPHDAAVRKRLQDCALLSFECFLYRCCDEKEVWTHLLTQSIDAQRRERLWKDEHEGKVLFFLAGILRKNKAYVAMLRELPGVRQAELIPIDLGRLIDRHELVRTQAHSIDDALSLLKSDSSRLVETIGALAFIWAHYDLEEIDKWRLNEVLLLMSALIYNTAQHVENLRRPEVSEGSVAVFEEAFEYFLLLLHAVEWPTHWKQPLIGRIGVIFPALPGVNHRAGAMPGVSKEAVLGHKYTKQTLEMGSPAPPEGREFFDRHRQLYGWVMDNDEAITQMYVHSKLADGTRGLTV